MFPFHFVAAMLGGWLQREQEDVIAFLREENRLLKARFKGRLRFNDHERRRLAELGHRVGRRLLADVATIVTPDTIRRGTATGRAQWALPRQSREAARPAGSHSSPGSADSHREPEVGVPRIQGALKNLGHHVGRSTIARILKTAGVPPSRARPMTWRTFMRAHWPALLAADFFTTEVWTVHGLVTYYTAFVIELRSRRVHILGSTPHPDDTFLVQAFKGCDGGGRRAPCRSDADLRSRSEVEPRGGDAPGDG